MGGWREEHFKALRSTATLQAWRKRERAAASVGLPFILGPAMFSGMFAAFAGRLFHHGGLALLAVASGWLGLTGVSMTVGVLLMRRYRRTHPVDFAAH